MNIILEIILYLLLFLLITFLVYWYKIYKRTRTSTNSNQFAEALLYFIWGMYGSPIYFILGVYGIKSKDFPDGP